MKKPRHYFNRTYLQDYLFFIGWKASEFEKYCEDRRMRINMSNSAGVAISTDLKSGINVILIWVEKKRDYCAIHHEANHAAAYTLDAVGVLPSFKNDEAFTYLSDDLFRFAMEE